MNSAHNQKSLSFLKIVAFIGVISAPLSAKADLAEDAWNALVRGDVVRAFQLAENPAKAGDPRAALVLARLYASGRAPGGTRDQAYAWYRQAADSGHALAQLEFGIFLTQSGEAFENRKLAADYFEKAAKQDLPDAAYNLGLIYSGGKGRRQNWTEAAKWLGQAADKNHVEATYNLGVLYQEGLGVKQDRKEAARLIGKAATAGYPHAQFDYGVLVMTGQGVQADPAIGVLWLKSAAEKGNALAQNRYARALSGGVGVERDEFNAAKWHLIARNQGISDLRLDLVLETLSDEDRSKAEAEAKSFAPKRGPQNAQKPS